MATDKSSHLVSLPAELRNRIYLAIFDGTIVTIGNPAVSLSRTAPKTTAPSVLLTCHQLYEEAVGIYYSTVTFVGKYSGDLGRWLKALPDKHAQALTDLRFDAYERRMHTCWITGISIQDARFAEDMLVNIIDKQLRSSSMDHLRGRTKASVMTRAGELIWTTSPVESFEASKNDEEVACSLENVLS